MSENIGLIIAGVVLFLVGLARVKGGSKASNLGSNIGSTDKGTINSGNRAPEAASAVPSGHDEVRIGDLEKEADALYQQGDEFGDNNALLAAIERYKQLVELKPRARAPLEWATTQVTLGIALWRLGEREKGRRGSTRPFPPFAKP